MVNAAQGSVGLVLLHMVYDLNQGFVLVADTPRSSSEDVAKEFTAASIVRL